MPVRWLLGPGLLLVGAGLFVMGGLSGASSWTHLIPGLLVAGLGVGLVNPPLASTAIGVVPPHQAGMAAGVNSTFRPVGTLAPHRPRASGPARRKAARFLRNDRVLSRAVLRRPGGGAGTDADRPASLGR